MEEYNDYRITIKPAGSIGTPWQSDTVFGHLVWLVAMKEGNDAAQSFLEPFLDGDPPFILSDGFPGECLPVPMVDYGGTVSHAHSFEEYVRFKKTKKAQFITTDSFTQARKDKNLRSGFINEPYSTVEILHASLNRNTNSTGDGGQLFSTHETFLEKIHKTFSVYTRCKQGEDIMIRDLFGRLSMTGYGRDKSTGTGAFDIESIEPFDGFSPIDGSDGFISLSSFVPAENDPTDGRWRMRIKRGFLGEQAGSGNPFKRPLIQFEPGAVFKTETEPKPWYGRIVGGISPGMPEAVQNCMSIAVPCRN